MDSTIFYTNNGNISPGQLPDNWDWLGNAIGQQKTEKGGSFYVLAGVALVLVVGAIASFLLTRKKRNR